MPMGGLWDITVRPNSKHEWLKSFFPAHLVEVCLFVSSSLLIDTKQQRKTSRCAFRCPGNFSVLEHISSASQLKNENSGLCNNNKITITRNKTFRRTNCVWSENGWCGKPPISYLPWLGMADEAWTSSCLSCWFQQGELSVFFFVVLVIVAMGDYYLMADETWTSICLSCWFQQGECYLLLLSFLL